MSYEGYEAAISNVVACAKAEGLDIQGPWPDWSGLELEYGVLVDEGDPKGHVDIFDRCYAEYGEFVTQAYYLEIANQRSQRFMELLGCASRSGGASLGEVLTAQGVSVGALLSETPPGVLEECTAR